MTQMAGPFSSSSGLGMRLLHNDNCYNNNIIINILIYIWFVPHKLMIGIFTESS